ncbi:NAD(P)-dependent oxidoreductase [uncultured Pseudodesulfovibrio sp.]|uniref:NAD-dependent epimerase/dehydratase family protein n=1 Tax=uncultured Pseudodesulfovibrio sp. TaxID=2035858 RepID=UPI0029C6123A|nr:NAD(P)-dependent oxidoreductase [uncultured Pseudodesulfovibrio sp.]
MRFTIFGATGFIGSFLLEHLRAQGHDCIAPEREEIPTSQDLGHVFYCIGLTADFRTRLADTVNAHVCHLLQILTRCTFDRLCYLSSTRVYSGQDVGIESAMLTVDPSNPSDVYNISKLMGESACLNISKKTVVVRLSNVFHPNDTSDNFLNSILREAATGRLVLQTSLDSAKDYILLDDVVTLLPQILESGKERIYNLASGKNTTHKEIVEQIGCEVKVLPDVPRVIYPSISVERLHKEFGNITSNILESISQTLNDVEKLHS